MHHPQPCGSNPRLVKTEPWLTPTPEPLSLYTSPTAHVSTLSLVFSLVASVFLLYPISIHTPIHTKLIAPLLYIHTIPIYFPLDLVLFHLFLRLFRTLAVKNRSDRSDFLGFAIQSDYWRICV